MKLEADGLCTAIVVHPKGAPERFAFIIEHQGMDLQLYFFVERHDIDEVIESLIEMRGHDA